MYRDHVQHLEPSVSKKLASLTIVGMRYYPQAHEKIVAASLRPADEQLLFLVADINNPHDKNAVALHDGRVKLGHVIAQSAGMVKRELDKLSAEHGQDQVLVVQVAPIKDAGDFAWSTSLNIKVVGYVYERIARKLARAVPENRN